MTFQEINLSAYRDDVAPFEMDIAEESLWYQLRLMYFKFGLQTCPDLERYRQEEGLTKEYCIGLRNNLEEIYNINKAAVEVQIGVLDWYGECKKRMKEAVEAYEAAPSKENADKIVECYYSG